MPKIRQQYQAKFNDEVHEITIYDDGSVFIENQDGDDPREWQEIHLTCEAMNDLIIRYREAV